MSEVLSSLSDDMAAAVAAASPSVVRVAARDRLPASGIVWSTDGAIVTAHHVVERNDNILVGLPDGRTVPATLVGRDSTTDLAVLRAEASGLTPPTWTEPDSLRVGHLVLALGRPAQMSHSQTVRFSHFMNAGTAFHPLSAAPSLTG